LSETKRDRLKVLHEVGRGQLTQSQAAAQLGMTERGFRKLLKRYREKKDAAVVHGLRNRRSNRWLKDEKAAQALDAVKRDYSDFWPHAGGRVSAQGLRSGTQSGNTAPTADPGRDLEGETAEDKRSPCVAAAAQLPWRTGAVGYQYTRLAGGAGAAEGVSDRAD
jgi:hypothetical protein